VIETVAWTVLDGKELPPTGPIHESGGETIVNLKVGARIGFGQDGSLGTVLGKSDLYVGYGRALTGTFWYKDILRVEYRVRF
jgi:hypothetical protein